MIRKRSRAQGVQNRRIQRHLGQTQAPWPTLLASDRHHARRVGHGACATSLEIRYFDSYGPSTTTNA